MLIACSDEATVSGADGGPIDARIIGPSDAGPGDEGAADASGAVVTGSARITYVNAVNTTTVPDGDLSTAVALVPDPMKESGFATHAAGFVPDPKPGPRLRSV
jgi:hypothetical protein